MMLGTGVGSEIRQPLGGGVHGLGARQHKRGDLVQAAWNAAVWLLFADCERVDGF